VLNPRPRAVIRATTQCGGFSTESQRELTGDRGELLPGLGFSEYLVGIFSASAHVST